MSQVLDAHPNTTFGSTASGRKQDISDGTFLRKTQDDYRGLVQIGQKFGNWCVISEEVQIRSGYRYVLCSDLPWESERWVSYDTLRAGKSTGSKKRPRTETTRALGGNAERKRLESVWGMLIKRCQNPACREYKWYGARGIKVSEEFQNFATFAAYVKELPGFDSDTRTIDRIDNNGDYERGNVRWVTHAEQQRNKRSNVYVEVDGETICFEEFTRRCAISRKFIKKLLALGHTTRCLVSMEGQSRGGSQLRSVRHCRCGAETPLHDLDGLRPPNRQ